METDWRPTATHDVLRARAWLLQSIRAFMLERDILEVETPVLVNAGVTDPAIRNLTTALSIPGSHASQTFYLQTSPEYAMKRLLADGSGPVFQICKVFRDSESGPLHNPEFTLLEWYRPGCDHHGLMAELSDLLVSLGLETAEKRTYRDLFLDAVGADAITAGTDELRRLAAESGFVEAPDERSLLLDFLFSHRVVPALGHSRPVFVMHFPACQAALARLLPDQPEFAERFELVINGIEIANGFHELTDPVEQRQRFQRDRSRRRADNAPDVPVDKRLLAALETGLPECAGVAVGLDRLLLCLLRCGSIDQVLTFPVDRA